MAPTDFSALGNARTQRGFTLFVGASVGLHVVGIGVWLFLSSHRAPPIRPDDAIIKTKLVKLGKKRDEKALPRLKPPPKAPAKAPVPAPQPPPEKTPPKPPVEAKTVEPPKEAPKPTAKGILDKFAENNDAPERPDLNKIIDRVADDEGDEKGSKIGEEISGRLKAEYNDKVRAEIRRNLTAPQTIDQAERMRLKTDVVVRIGSEGNVLDARVSKGSGNAAFDNAALRAAKISEFDPPPLTVRDFYARGVIVGVCPGQCL